MKEPDADHRGIEISDALLQSSVLTLDLDSMRQTEKVICHQERKRESTMPRKKILFIGEATSLSHVVRPLVLSSSLDAGEFDIHFAGGRRFNETILSANMKFTELPAIEPKDFLGRLISGRAPYERGEIKSYVEAETALLKKLKPDLVVGDFRLTLSISAKQAGIPYLALCNAYWSPNYSKRIPLPDAPMTKIIGYGVSRLIYPLVMPTLLRMMASPFNKELRLAGLPEVEEIRDLIAGGDRTGYMDLPEIFKIEAEERKSVYLGPVYWSPKVTEPSWFEDLKFGGKTIFMSMGSSGDPSLLRSMVKALKELPARLLVSTASKFPATELHDGKKVFAADFLDGEKAVGLSALTINNGGSLSTYQSLSVGCPVLGAPSNADQYLNMEGICSKGAGLLIRSTNVSKPSFIESVERLLDESRYVTEAKKLGKTIERSHGTGAFAKLVREMTCA